MLLITALGNPGDAYENTRHNAAWIMLDAMLGDDASWDFDKYAQADVMWDTVGGVEVGYVKPQTFMNNSGLSVAHFLRQNELTGEQIVVVYDDIDLPMGRLKISFDRGDGGHNGVKSIMNHVGHRSFVRIRIGVSPLVEDGIDRPAGSQQRDFVLNKFRPEDIKQLHDLAPKLEAIIKEIAVVGHEMAMNKFN